MQAHTPQYDVIWLIRRLFALTHVGRELFGKIRASETVLLDRLFADIPADDIERTRRTLQAMYFHNLKQGETDESF